MHTKWQGPLPSIYIKIIDYNHPIVSKEATTFFLNQNAETYHMNGEMLSSLRYIKHYIRFPKNIKPFWDDTRYIVHIDPNVRYVQYPSIDNFCNFFIRGRYQIWQNLEAKGNPVTFLTFFENFIIIGPRSDHSLP